MKNQITASRVTKSASTLLLLTAVGFFLMFGWAEAKVVVRTSDTVSVSENQVIPGNFYGGGGTVSLAGLVEEDALLAGAKVVLNGQVNKNASFIGGDVSVNGDVNGDAFLVGGNVDVNGTIGSDLRVFGGQVVISKPVMGDLFVMAGTVHILSTASVAGDVLLYGGKAVIEGSVGGKIMGSVDDIRVDSKVDGGIDITTGKLTLGDKAEIAGGVNYVSNAKLIRSPKAVVEGDITRSDTVALSSQKSVYSTFFPLLILIFSTLTWFLLSRRTLQTITEAALRPNLKPILFGFLAVVVTPFAISILMASLIGTIVSVILLLSYILLMLLAFIAIPMVAGHLLLKLFTKTAGKPSLLSIVVGVVAILLLMVLKGLGVIVMFALMLMVMGAIIELLLVKQK